MIGINYYYNTGMFQKTSGFAEKRSLPGCKDYLHSGEDFISEQGKSQRIFNLIAGNIDYIGSNKAYGNYVIIKQGAESTGTFYSLYCHLYTIDSWLSIGQDILAGEPIGYMGNTGNCWTKDKNGKYRHVTENEVMNRRSKKGVHLHLSIFQKNCKKGDNTVLLKILQIAGLCFVNQEENDIKYFWQWDNLYYHPEIVIKYFKMLQRGID